MSAKTSHFETVSDAQLGEMAQAYAQALDTNTSIKADYLRILVARAQVAARGKRPPTVTQVRKAVDAVHERMYAVVLKAITTPELAPDDKLPAIERARRSLERNRRSNFARTAKYTLDSWIDAGGKLMSLRPADVSRESLRAAPAGDGRSAGGLARSVERRGARLLKAATDLVAEDRPAAERLVAALMSQLGALVAKPLTRRTIRKGDLTLHPGQAAH